jgi:hypothetical protein
MEWIDGGVRLPQVFRTVGRTTVSWVSEMRDFCRNRWPDLLAIACVGVAWLLTAMLGT